MANSKKKTKKKTKRAREVHTYVGPYGRVQQQRQYAWLFDFQGQSISARNLHYSIRNHALFVRNGCEPSKLRSQTQQHILLVNAARPKKKNKIIVYN